VSQHLVLIDCGGQNGHLVYDSLVRPENYIEAQGSLDVKSIGMPQNPE
jgi:hypothetical protein